MVCFDQANSQETTEGKKTPDTPQSVTCLNGGASLSRAFLLPFHRGGDLQSELVLGMTPLSPPYRVAVSFLWGNTPPRFRLLFRHQTMYHPDSGKPVCLSATPPTTGQPSLARWGSFRSDRTRIDACQTERLYDQKMWIISKVVLLLAILWTVWQLLHIRARIRNGDIVMPPMIASTLVFAVFIVLVMILGSSPFHLFWLFPLSFPLGLLVFLFPVGTKVIMALMVILAGINPPGDD
jgi:hypothetical protein